MNNQKYNSLVVLGKFLSQFASFPYVKDENLAPNNDIYFKKFEEILVLAEQQNGWFTPENLQFACKSWAKALREENIRKWLEKYDLENVSPKKVAIIMAGNIPLVGFHDFLSVLVSGHKAIVKLSSEDKILLPFIADYLQHIEPAWQEQFIFTDERITDFDAVIATGSNNTARYFEYYFGKKPHIIRRNRNSVAVLTGKETEKELFELGKDIFTYFGLGCRSVSKLFVPQNYDFDRFFKSIYPFKDIINGQKYANNYDYNKAVYLMSLFKLRENGFLVLKEDASYASPIATLFYEYYDSSEGLKEKLQADRDKIQCVVAKDFIENEIPFGQTQAPQLWDYADGIDTVTFLTNL
ncbi:acyl-CoA reductase [Capnocytophaga felis]|uniref:Acyl-CoA reductase n=1 Tax=Capnocytophaga felis TaxID=2267611 RepID=A0A5M4B6N1_9FLAO|nr:acyl-CoA reductase [Capnocytophaga felis]GET45010.1 acyl-CoA reductase [Capnocytophaga felis]GET47827.1 acyl-CoA reductase [Capnocytophaga felis]